MAAADTEIPEVIRLQLRKPKSWNWELSTSKSSPNIVLPIIQLFDYKGQLLVEATDNGNALRRCWSSSNHSCLTNCSSNSARRRKSSSNSVKRSRSDTVFKDKHVAPTEEQYQIELEGEPEKKRDLSNPRQHRRSRSDDMFRRKLIPTKESMRRAEQDGYKNFLTTIIPEVAAEETEKKQKKIRRIYSAEIISNGNKSSNTQVSDVRGKKYITRTSKAGTLLLCEDESFLQKTSGKRSRQASKEYPIDNAESPIYNGTDVDGARGKTYHCHLKNICDPHKGRCGEKKEKGSERSRSNPWANQRNPADPLDRKELRYSHSIGKFSQHHRDGNVGISKENKSFPLENGFSLAEGRTPTCKRNKCQNKCECETLFVKNGWEIHSNGAFIENNKKKKKRGGKLQIGDGVMDEFFDGFNNRQHHNKVTRQKQRKTGDMRKGADESPLIRENERTPIGSLNLDSETSIINEKVVKERRINPDQLVGEILGKHLRFSFLK